MGKIKDTEKLTADEELEKILTAARITEPYPVTAPSSAAAPPAAKISIDDVIIASKAEFERGKVALKANRLDQAKAHFEKAQTVILESGFPLRGQLNNQYLSVSAFVAQNESQLVALPNLPPSEEEIAAKRAAELLGKMPAQKATGEVPIVLTWFNENLNDPYSMRIVRWSKITKTQLRNEPYWLAVVRLRAKNAYGAYVLSEYYFYIRRNRIVAFDKS